MDGLKNHSENCKRKGVSGPYLRPLKEKLQNWWQGMHILNKMLPPDDLYIYIYVIVSTNKCCYNFMGVVCILS